MFESGKSRNALTWVSIVGLGVWFSLDLVLFHRFKDTLSLDGMSSGEIAWYLLAIVLLAPFAWVMRETRVTRHKRNLWQQLTLIGLVILCSVQFMFPRGQDPMWNHTNTTLSLVSAWVVLFGLACARQAYLAAFPRVLVLSRDGKKELTCRKLRYEYRGDHVVFLRGRLQGALSIQTREIAPSWFGPVLFAELTADGSALVPVPKSGWFAIVNGNYRIRATLRGFARDLKESFNEIADALKKHIGSEQDVENAIQHARALELTTDQWVTCHDLGCASRVKKILTPGGTQVRIEAANGIARVVDALVVPGDGYSVMDPSLRREVGAEYTGKVIALNSASTSNPAPVVHVRVDPGSGVLQPRDVAVMPFLHLIMGKKLLLKNPGDA